MEVATFIRKDESQLNQDVATCLTPLENKMCDFLLRVEIRGKPSMVSAMELLAESREQCGVLKENREPCLRTGGGGGISKGLQGSAEPKIQRS